MKFLQKLKDKWEIETWLQFWIIMIVFSITGSVASWSAKHILFFFGISRETMNPFLFWPIRILLIFPAYQILLLFVGTAFGQFKFFWAFEKKTLSRIAGRRK
jgi:manganese efflux pump family protein